MESKRNKAIFLDRDGVIDKLLYDHDRGIYSAKDMDDFELIPGAKDAILKFKEKGYLVIVITNQPGLTYGYIKEKDYDEINNFLKSLGVDDVFTCVHSPDAKCECRKPSPKMINDAAVKYDIDLSNSVMVGDNLSDIKAGKVCGKTVFIGNKRADIMNLFSERKIEPDGHFVSLIDAVDFILK
jgi:D-glycero-D-manno-heptose 1,7-bisphosphate phosphatase